jgi:ribonuclease VapC
VILDSSAIVAIFLKEPGFEAVVEKVAAADALGIGAPTASECAIVLSARLGRNGRGLLGQFLHEQDVAVVTFGEDHWKAAAEAYAKYGRGRHRAALNFGDCLAYAVASLSGEPLLAVGRDFPHTDIELA